jgi:hypothetical protein
MCTTWVFLDVDGVLNDYSTKDRTPNGFVGLDDDKIALLAGFVHEVGADIVLTSTWKDQNLWLRELHPGADLAYLLNKLADHGLNISGYTRDGSRGTAIREWLDDHPGRAVIFDDIWFESFRAAKVSRYLVMTSSRTGLQPKHIRYAKRLLEQQ